MIHSSEIRFSEIISALSVALDITQGHPEGHSMRSALIGMRLAEQLRLSSNESSALFYALLLKDLGCSSNAAKMAYLFGNDDQRVKRSARMIDWTKPGQCIRHCWTNCGSEETSTLGKLKRVASIMSLGAEGGRKIAEVRCERGADIARMLNLPEATARAIYDLDEHWNGRGNPRGLRGEDISLLGRICCLAQTVEVFFSTFGLEAALDIAIERRGRWFDPDLVDALLALRSESAFWQRLESPNPADALSHVEPQDAVMIADETCLDRVAEAFAQVVDAKSPWTYQHSTRVAEITVGIARQFNCPTDVVRDLRRAALLHDVGKLGVSNRILDKPGRPTDAEFAEIRKHAEYSHRILQRIEAFQELAEVAGAHHERLDGRGYHRGLSAEQLPWATRALTVADIFEAMSAKRPYRDAMSWEEICELLHNDVGAGVDAECVAALEHWLVAGQLESNVDQQLAEVDRLISKW
ncbi:MAG: HD domain-containing protein [Planctomycetales bacterium]|nr:HD domain-containing protein [Planctomycetales bacterium]